MKDLILRHWRGFETLVCLVCGLAIAGIFYFPVGAPLVWFLLIPPFLVLFRTPVSRKRTLCVAGTFVFPFLFASYLVGFTIDVGFSPPAMFFLDLAVIIAASLAQGIPLVAALFLGSRLSFPAPLRAGLAATLWTGAEWLCTAGPFAFPVRNLNVTQWAFAPVVRTASLLGALLITFLMILTAALFAVGARAFWAKRREVIKKEGDAATQGAKLKIKEGRGYGWTALIIFALVSWGSDYLIPPAAPADHLEVIAVQHNIPTTESASMRFEKALELAEKALQAKAEDLETDPLLTVVSSGQKPWSGGDLLVFPESTAQFLSQNESMQNRLSRLAQTYDIDILIGGVKSIGGENGGNTDRYVGGGLRELNENKDASARLDNAVYYINRKGLLSEKHYAKQLLVPFFENGYIRPFEFIPGRNRGVFQTERAKVGALVCFESLIAGSVRETANQGAGLIAVPSNDAYLESPWIKIMHFSQNFLRAAESGRVVLQAATNGVTGAADINGAYLTAETKHGRVRSVLPIEQEGVLLMQVPIYDHVTPYAVVGDIWLAGLVMAVIVIWAVWGRRGRASKRSRPVT